MKVNEYVRAASLKEAYSLKKASPKNKVLGGGLWLKKGNADVDVLIDLSRLGLDKIKEENQQAMEENMMAAQAAGQQMQNGGQLNQREEEGRDQSKSAVEMPNEVPNKKDAQQANKKLKKQTAPTEQNKENGNSEES